MNRRQFVVAAGTATAIALAGCSGDDAGGPESDGPESVVEEFFTAFTSGDAQRMEELSHPEFGLEADDIELEEAETTSIEVDVITDDVGVDDIESEDGATNIAGYTLFISPETVEEVTGDETVALTEVTVEFQSGDPLTAPALAATHEGEWRVLDYAVA